MNPDISITIKFATAPEGVAISEVQNTEVEDQVPMVPSIDVLPELDDSHVPEPPAYEELYEEAEGSVPPPNPKSIGEIGDDHVFDPPEFEQFEEMAENDVPLPPEVVNESECGDFNELTDLDDIIPPLPSE